MKRIGAMAAVALIALLLALPLGAAMAQDGGPTAGNQPPATLYGTVTADGLPVPDGDNDYSHGGRREGRFDHGDGRREVWAAATDGGPPAMT